ncbi:SMC-Scp complex subunit ScpB [Roseomonas sp. OT10]|uniref:SMC-Scp complex subunit ScpB n=1 Tax=Roseomonas cutis TaxID=2897332 RepID=UPI001E5DB7E0|nr:SMC-Scp complex subunit ScpB [Roseomonas sp. OT10]UFN50732.1 SMC-Scp complex subunit ScpB [Roseomonas sp. OT10]
MRPDEWEAEGRPTEEPTPPAEAPPAVPPEPAAAEPDPPRDGDLPPSDAALRLAEALLFASDRPVPLNRLAAALGAEGEARAVMRALRERYAGRGVEVAEIAGGWAFRTAPDLAARLTRVIEVPKRLPRSAMEALAAIAWRQPVTRSEIEELRGATLSQNTLEALLEQGLIAPRGRKEAPGRPVLWGTTPRFLEQFGLRSLSELPRQEDLLTAEAPPLGSVAATGEGEGAEPGLPPDHGELAGEMERDGGA